MLGSEGFEFEGEEYTVTLKFEDDGTYEGVESIGVPVYSSRMVLVETRPLSRESATTIWWGLTEQQRDVLHERCLEDAQLTRQADEGDSVWAAF